MLLSQAIRKGSEQTKQVHGQLFLRVQGEIQGACAIGLAYLAIFGPPTLEELCHNECIYGKMDDLGWNKLSTGSCPAEGCNYRHPDGVHLNDDHLWTAEQIADWYEANGL